jgi:tellurite resistance protein TerC
LLPITHGDHREHGHQFFVREHRALYITPMFLVLLVIESTDVIFAVDSVPAVLGLIPKTFAPSQKAFIAFSSNVFAILGLRALYFLLAGMVDIFRYLHYGLAGVLGFVGLKMIAEYWMELHEMQPMPPWMSLTIVAVLLGTSIAASIAVQKRG